MVLNPDMSGLWVATSDSSIRHWPLNNRVLQSHDNNIRGERDNTGPLVTEPSEVIRGGPSIRSYSIQVSKYCSRDLNTGY